MLRFLSNNLLKSTTSFEESLRICSMLKTPNLNIKFFSKKSHLVTLDKGKAVTSLLVTYGLTETQISSLIKNRPVLLKYNLEKTLKPKLGFFSSIGVSPSDLMTILKADPAVLLRNLDNQIIPSYHFLKIIFKSDEDVIYTIKRSSWVLKQDLRKYVAPNIALLKELGVPDSRIFWFLKTQPRAFMQTPARFKAIVDDVRAIGFDPLKFNFLIAIHGYTGFSKSTWERKFKAYRKWGWSDNEIRSAFKKAPACMGCSEEKINKVMDFLVNKMGWDVADIAKCPAIFLSSVENYTAPRCLVVHFLLSKGVMKRDFSLSSVVFAAEKRFLKKFVTKYLQEFPELLNLYNGIVDPVGATINQRGPDGTKDC